MVGWGKNDIAYTFPCLDWAEIDWAEVGSALSVYNYNIPVSFQLTNEIFEYTIFIHVHSTIGSFICTKDKGWEKYKASTEWLA